MLLDLHRLLAMALMPSPPGGRPMATSNPTITGNWTLIVPEGDEFLLTLPLASQAAHVAIGDSTSSDPEPPPNDLLGHAMVPGADGINRALLGPGPVYARCTDPAASMPVALTAWTHAA